MRGQLCGWCMTGHHKDCKKVVEYYDKKWYCECKECGNNDEGRSSSTDRGTSTDSD
jgi:hypothetical protein